jgi:hypothetical protein
VFDAINKLANGVKASNLKTLNLTGVNLGSKGMSKLGDSLIFLLNRRSMKELVLRNTNLFGKGALSLAKCITLNKIAYLDISDNFFKNREL